MAFLDVGGVKVAVGYLSGEAQTEMVDAIREVVRAAPLVTPVTPRGQPMSVRMTAAGRFGWISDRQGYRYAPGTQAVCLGHRSRPRSSRCGAI